MYNRYKDRVQFMAVYVREAHPTDGWRSPGNDRVGISFAQPTTFMERTGVAEKCCSALKITMPLLVDALDDRVGHAYSGMPDRMYVIDRHGKVAYKSGRGPFGFKPGEMEQALAMLLLDQGTGEPAVQEGRRESGHLPVLPNEQAWKRLPGATGEAPPLPTWARMLAGTLPKTTARMLELDAMHRTGDRLDPRLRSMMRWAAADEDQCATARAYAELDMRRAGMSAEEVRAFTLGKRARNASADGFTLSEAEGAALTFARKMMQAAHSVTDQEVKYLDVHYGAKQLVAMVALLAHASFQDRMFFALDAPVEINGPLPPLTVTFKRDKKASPKIAKKNPPTSEALPSRGVATAAATAVPGAAADLDWLAQKFSDLKEQLERQKARPLRIRVPSNDELRRRLPPDHRLAKGTDILWSRVCYGYQPKLTEAWFECVNAFRAEARQDRILQQSIFWVVTRSLQCFY